MIPLADKRVAAATIRRVWLDTSMTTAEAAAEVGLARSNLWRRAMALGLPPRKKSLPAIRSEALFRAMWKANVCTVDMAAYFGVKRDTIFKTKRRLGLAPRARGNNQSVITIAQFRELQLAARMAASVREEDHSAQSDLGENVVRVRP